MSNESLLLYDSPFNMVNGKIYPSSFVLTVPEFKKLIDKDKSKDKELSNKQLAFIAHLCDFRSPYREFPEEHRKDILIKDFFNNKFTPDEDITAAIEKYKQLSTTRAIKLLDSANLAVDKLIAFFEEIDLNERDDKNHVVHKATDLARNLKEVGPIIQSMKKLEEEVKKGLVSTGTKIRGGGNISEWEQA